jgi:hypothetical protein
MLITLAVALAFWCAHAQSSATDELTPATAINILIDPDAAMLKAATAANERLRRVYPDGFALDATHHPHITCLQRFVKTADLDDVYQAVSHVLADEKPTTWTLKAYKYSYSSFGGLGLAGIVIEPTDDLIRFQQKLIDAVEPFTVKAAAAAAFFTTAEDPEINQATIDYVKSFVPNASGENFSPHVTVGAAPKGVLEKTLDEKFEAFTFPPAGVSVYQLGNFGTARKKLKSWELTR